MMLYVVVCSNVLIAIYCSFVEPAGEVEESDSGDEADANQNGPRKKLAKFSVGTMAAEPKAKAKAKASSKVAAARPAAATAAASFASTPAVTNPGKSPRDESPSQSGCGSKKLSKSDRAVDDALKALSHDEEMARVAKKHLGTQKGSSTKCLHYHGVKNILQGERPGNALTGVRVL